MCEWHKECNCSFFGRGREIAIWQASLGLTLQVWGCKGPTDQISVQCGDGHYEGINECTLIKQSTVTAWIHR